MEFTPNMVTHVALIDEQHKTLFNHIDLVEAMGKTPVSKEKAMETISFLGDYIALHFNDEEKLQQNSHYPRIKEHQKLHKWYIGEYHKLRAEYKKHGYSEYFAHLLNESIVNWYTNHVLVEDIALGKFLGTHIV